MPITGIGSKYFRDLPRQRNIATEWRAAEREVIMSLRIRRLHPTGALVVSGVAAAWLLAGERAQPIQADRALASQLVRAEEAVPTRGPWGEWRRYLRGETHGTRDLVV